MPRPKAKSWKQREYIKKAREEGLGIFSHKKTEPVVVDDDNVEVEEDILSQTDSALEEMMDDDNDDADDVDLESQFVSGDGLETALSALKWKSAGLHSSMKRQRYDGTSERSIRRRNSVLMKAASLPGVRPIYSVLGNIYTAPVKTGWFMLYINFVSCQLTNFLFS